MIPEQIAWYERLVEESKPMSNFGTHAYRIVWRNELGGEVRKEKNINSMIVCKALKIKSLG